MNKNWLEHYPPGIGHTIDTDDDATLVGIIDAACRDYADRDAYSSMGNTIRFADVDRLSAAFAGYLQQVRGLQPGERFAIMMPNCLQYVVALFGALRAGLTVVNVNPLYTARELEHQLTDADVRTLLVMENFAATLEKVVVQTVESGSMTKDLALLVGPDQGWLTTMGFLEKIDENLNKALAG